jgi:hypothetical protein
MTIRFEPLAPDLLTRIIADVVEVLDRLGVGVHRSPARSCPQISWRRPAVPRRRECRCWRGPEVRAALTERMVLAARQHSMEALPLSCER